MSNEREPLTTHRVLDIAFATNTHSLTLIAHRFLFMNLSCEQCRELLALHVEHDAWPADVVAHLESCANCAALYADKNSREYSMLRATVMELRTLPPVAVPADLRARISAQIAQEASATQSARKPRFSIPRFAVPRFSIPQPIIPRWATFALPTLAVAACMLLLLSDQPAPDQFFASQQNESELRAEKPRNSSSSLAQKSGAQRPNSQSSNAQNRSGNAAGKNANRAEKTTTSRATSSTRSLPDNLPSPDNQAPAASSNLDSGVINGATNAETDFDKSRKNAPRVTRDTKPPGNSSPRKSNAVVAPRNSVPATQPAPRMAKSPLAKTMTTASNPRLFARLETTPRETTSEAAIEYSMSREAGSNRSGATEDQAPKTARRDAESLRSMPSRAGDELNDDVADATNGGAAGSANDDAGTTADTASESGAESFSAQSAPAQTDNAAPELFRAAPNAARTGENGALRSRAMPAPVAPRVAAPVTKAAPDEAANLSAQSSATAPSDVQANATPASNKKALAQPKTSSTREQRKRVLILTLPRSGFLRVQIRWPLGATQTVWSGRGTRGQKLRLEVSTPQNIASPSSRNKNARLQVSVQEAAPLLKTSRTVWKTIAREEIVIQ